MPCAKNTVLMLVSSSQHRQTQVGHVDMYVANQNTARQNTKGTAESVLTV
jgi:hypothetical protein